MDITNINIGFVLGEFKCFESKIATNKGGMKSQCTQKVDKGKLVQVSMSMTLWHEAQRKITGNRIDCLSLSRPLKNLINEIDNKINERKKKKNSSTGGEQGTPHRSM